MTGSSASIGLSHWGAFEADVEDGRLVATRPWPGGGADARMIAALPGFVHSANRIACPHVREGWLRDGHRSDGRRRGRESMVPVEWDVALDLVAQELLRVREEHGPASVFAGSYGWSSAGRFHHARTQLRRFHAGLGGFTDQCGNYSWGAAEIILKHVLGSSDAVSGEATDWRSIREHTDVLIAFGGLNPKNWRVTSGGAGFHHMPEHVRRAAEAGTRFVVISPAADDVPSGVDALHISPRPGTDTALMLGLAYELHQRGRSDRAFLASHCSGSHAFLAYLDGRSDGVPKTLDWAAVIADVPRSSLDALTDLVMTGTVMLTASWSLQRARHGEQPYWALVALASLLGQIGLPGGGFSFGYGSLNAVGQGAVRGLVPTLPVPADSQGVRIPAARIADMLEFPGRTVPFELGSVTYPDVRLVHWAGGNPFHHAQDLFRLQRLWSRPETIIVQDPFWTPTARRADIVLPTTTNVERNDIGGSSRDPHVFYMRQLIPPVGDARNDHDILAALALRLDHAERFTEGMDEKQWLQRLWDSSRLSAAGMGLMPPTLDELRSLGVWRVPCPPTPAVLLSGFRASPTQCPLATESGLIVLHSSRLEALGREDVPAHPRWQVPEESLVVAADDQLALLSRQPDRWLHSQHAGVHQEVSEVLMNPTDASSRGLQQGNFVRVYSPRGACKAQLRIDNGCRTGVAIMATGHWFHGLSDGDGDVDVNGNPNALIADMPSSTLAQATAAQTCLVRVIAWD